MTEEELIKVIQFITPIIVLFVFIRIIYEIFTEEKPKKMDFNKSLRSLLPLGRG